MATKVSDIKNAVKAALDEIGVNDASFLAGVDNVNLDKLIESKIDDAIQMIYQSADEALLDTQSVTAQAVKTICKTEDIIPTGEDEDGPNRRVTVDPVVRVYLSGSFLRFVSARITGLSKVEKQEGTADVKTAIPGHEWPYPVYQFIPSTSPEYAKLKNRYTTGTEERPKVGMAITPSITVGTETLTSVRTLELYSLTDVESIEYVFDDEHTSTFEFEAEVDCQVIFKRSRTASGGADVTGDNDTYNIGPKLLRPVIYCIAGLVLQAWKDEHADSMINIAMTMAGVDMRNQQLK